MKSSNFLKALSLSVATIALSAGTAHAGVTNIYTGGSTLSANGDDIIGQCVGVQNTTNDATNAGLASGTYACHPASPASQYFVAGIGSGGALASFVNNTVLPASKTPAPGTLVTDTTVTPNTVYPWTGLQIAFSDAPLDTPDAAGSATTYLNDYTTQNTAAKRGSAWQVPIAAAPIALPYYLPSVLFGTSFYASIGSTATVSNSPTVSSTVTQLDLTTDMVCYIWTNATAKGAAVSGSRTWDNPIFTGTHAVAVAPKVGKITAYDSNLVASSVAGLAITPVRRLDGSGTTYIFTQWLSKNCMNYTAAGYSAPATNVTWPTFVTVTGSGSTGLLNSVKNASGSIGYITPEAISPAKGPSITQIVTPAVVTGGVVTTPAVYGSALPSAFLLTAGNKVSGSSPTFLYPTPTNATAAETGIVLPTKLTPTAWGTKLGLKFFKKAAKNKGYPIVGLTYAIGYSCYSNASTNDTYTGVKNYMDFLGTATAKSIITDQGLAPMPSYSSIVSLLNTASAKSTVAGLTAIANPATAIGTAAPKTCPNISTSTNL